MTFLYRGKRLQGRVNRITKRATVLVEDPEEIIGEKQVLGAPDLVVEILSPSTAHRDRGIKLDLHARNGVRQYWIADPNEDVVDVWRFADEPVARTLLRRAPRPAWSRALGPDRP